LSFTSTDFFDSLAVKSEFLKAEILTICKTYASLLLDQGENIKYIQKQLGHSSIQVTMDIYGHLMSDVNQEAAIKLGKTVLGGSDI
jgi:integrase